MAAAALTLEASDLFTLGSNFNIISSSSTSPVTNVATNDEVGNVVCDKNIEDMTNYTETASYCGSDLVTDLGILITTFGDVANSKCITGLTLSFTAAQYMTVEVAGHQHDTEPHLTGDTTGSADMSAFLPTPAFTTFDGFGVPDWGVIVGADASPSSATVAFTMTHVDKIDELGKHLDGKNITPRAELSMEFSGLPTSVTVVALETDLASLLVDSLDFGDSNSDYDTFAFTAHGHADIIVTA